jgi:uncharacterized protein (TIGR00251 family)
MNWYQLKNENVELNIFVKPNAKRTALIEVSPVQGLIISLHAKPLEGEANEELIRFLSKLFKTPKTQIKLVRGDHSRNKTINLPMNPIIKKFLDNPIE